MPPLAMPRDQRVRGLMCGLIAAAFFGLSTPLSKRLLGEVGPVLLAGWLYVSGGVALTAAAWARDRRDRPAAEARLRREDAPLVLGVVALGGVAGPVFMLLGLQRVTGFVGSLLLNLEAPLTMALAVVVFREHLSRREVLAAGAIVLGAAAFRLDPGPSRVDGLGIVLLAAACSGARERRRSSRRRPLSARWYRSCSSRSDQGPGMPWVGRSCSPAS